MKSCAYRHRGTGQHGNLHLSNCRLGSGVRGFVVARWRASQRQAREIFTVIYCHAFFALLRVRAECHFFCDAQEHAVIPHSTARKHINAKALTHAHNLKAAGSNMPTHFPRSLESASLPTICPALKRTVDTHANRGVRLVFAPRGLATASPTSPRNFSTPFFRTHHGIQIPASSDVVAEAARPRHRRKRPAKSGNHRHSGGTLAPAHRD